MRLFREEAKRLWNIGHVSLPTVKDYLELPDFGQLIVMSYVKGDGDIAEFVEKNGALDDESCCWILQRVLDALSYLHEYRKTVHCDIKPQNIILDVADHNATLVDFGLCVEGPDAMSRAKGGTEFYMPPEFRLGLPPIPASDIYSLGMTAVAMTGGDVRNGALPPDMHPELRELIGRMIRRDPLARPQNARKLNCEITELRRRVFGRTAAMEPVGFRGGVS